MTAYLEKAVMAAQLYLGAEGLPIRVQDRFYKRMQRAVASVAKKRDLPEQFANDEITREAIRRGRITPRPGKDY